MNHRLLTLILGIIALTSSACLSGKLQAPEATRGEVYSVQFPTYWTTREDKRTIVVPPPNAYEVRKNESGPSDELLFALKGPGTLSIERYAVRLDRQVTVSSATERAWDQAVLISSGNSYYEDPPAASFSAKDPLKPLPEFREDLYKGSGDRWSKILVSPKRTIVTVLTYTSPDQESKGDIIFGGGTVNRGRFYWDVYAVGSDMKIASGSFAFNGIAPGIISDSAQWLGEKYLLLPRDYSAQNCLLIALSDH